MKRFIVTSEQSKRDCIEFIRQQIVTGPIPVKFKVEIKEIKNTRSLEQNNLMWKLLSDISAQVVWYGEKLSKENWKDIFSASLRQVKIVPGISGGFVALGLRTSKMSVAEMNDMIALAQAFGIEHGVRFSAPEGIIENG